MSVKKSKFWSLFSLLLCLALAISACSPAGGEATQTQPTETTAAQETAGSEETEAPEAEGAYTDGEYTGSGVGMHSNIEVSVTVEGGKITQIDILSQEETPGLSDPAFEQIPEAIIEAQSTDVDVVTGATMTSQGIIEAVASALEGGSAGQDTTAELTIEPDVIVVGAGMAGLCTTVRAAELGLNVLLLEASVRVGGCIHYAGGTISGAGFKMQEENGIEDTPEAFYEDILELGGEGEFNEELAWAHCENSGAAIDWLDEDIGVDFGDRTLVGGAYTAMDTLRVARALGSYSMGAALGYLEPLEARLNEAIDAGNVQLMLNTTVTELVVEGDECTGVRCGDTEFSAPSVVLATGGYCYNEELLKLAGFENVISSAPQTSNGSGFYLAQAVGGVFDNMDKVVTFYGGGVPTDGFDMTYMANTSYPGRIYVDLEGNRVGNEDGNDINMWKDAEENKLYVIISGNMVDEETAFLRKALAQSSFPLENNGWDMLETMAAEGEYAFKADSLEELAELLGTENLVATVEQYNADVAAGEDSLFGRDPANMVALEEGPYYALLTVPYVWSGTSGGVRADGEGRLLREDGTAVEGLFLAGEILGPTNILGRINFGGINHSMCATWGMLAAEHAAERAGK